MRTVARTPLPNPHNHTVHAMLTKNSPEVQDLLTRIQVELPHLTGPAGNLWISDDGIEITYDQDAPTPELREFRPKRYSLLVTYHLCPSNYASGWDIHEGRDKNGRWWYIPTTTDDVALIKALQE